MARGVHAAKVQLHDHVGDTGHDKPTSRIILTQGQSVLAVNAKQEEAFLKGIGLTRPGFELRSEDVYSYSNHQPCR